MMSENLICKTYIQAKSQVQRSDLPSTLDHRLYLYLDGQQPDINMVVVVGGQSPLAGKKGNTNTHSNQIRHIFPCTDEMLWCT